MSLEIEEIRNICDADDCVHNNKQGVCYHGAIKLRKLHCLDYLMDKPYLDAQLKESIRERMYAFPRYELGVEDVAPVRSRKELNAKLDGKLPYHDAPPEKAGEEEKK